MASTIGAGAGEFDERLVSVIQNELAQGEQVVAQEAGDQGQAIALTGLRIIIAKAGLSATGELHGLKVGSFKLSDITAVNLRKGPLGAVIQICDDAADNASVGPRPDNIIVFTGADRVKKAQAFASDLEALTQMSVNRIDPTSKPVKEAAAVVKPAAPEVQEADEAVAHAEAVEASPEIAAPEESIPQEPEPEARSAFKPNPRLPKSVRKKEIGPNRMLVAFGVLAALVFVGMAIMAPLHDAQLESAPIGVSGTSQLNNVKLQAAAISNYANSIDKLLSKANSTTDAFKAVVRSSDKNAILSASRSLILDQVFREVADMSAPPGLAAAKEDLVEGLLSRKNAVAAAAGAASSSEAMNVRALLSRFDEADKQISRGRSNIRNANAAAELKVAELSGSGKKQ
ncbi:MAG: hypothetical protein GX139_05110 [Armatimonadetes bacterium]|jgi:hypothetical protein|nr:hypothetical protein [Armatimonadota bacterium]